MDDTLDIRRLRTPKPRKRGELIRDERDIILQRGETAISVNESTALIWEKCDGATNPKDIAQKVADDLDTEPVYIDAAVERIIHDLDNEDFVSFH